MINNVTKRRERTDIDRLMTRPTRKSPSAKGADIAVFVIRPLLAGRSAGTRNCATLPQYKNNQHHKRGGIPVKATSTTLADFERRGIPKSVFL
jgi:hypothetical protein